VLLDVVVVVVVIVVVVVVVVIVILLSWLLCAVCACCRRHRCCCCHCRCLRHRRRHHCRHCRRRYNPFSSSVSIWLLYFHCRHCCHRCHLVACTTVMRRHVTIYASRHDTDTTPGEPTRCNVADMVCVVSAKWRQHVGMSVVWGEKIPDTTPTFPAKSARMHTKGYSQHDKVLKHFIHTLIWMCDAVWWSL
jgi:hypothetical protein